MKKAVYLLAICFLFTFSSTLFPMQYSLDSSADSVSAVVHDESPSHCTKYSEDSGCVDKAQSENITYSTEQEEFAVPGYIPDAHDSHVVCSGFMQGKTINEKNQSSAVEGSVLRRMHVTRKNIKRWADEFITFLNGPGGTFFLSVCSQWYSIKKVMDALTSAGCSEDPVAYRHIVIDVENILVRILLRKSEALSSYAVQLKIRQALEKYLSCFVNQNIDMDKDGPFGLIYRTLNKSLPDSDDELFTEKWQDCSIAMGFLLIILNDLIMDGDLRKTLLEILSN